MKAERIEIYRRPFPRGFAWITHAIRVSHGKLSGLPKSYFPRAPKDGEHLIRVKVDPNGMPYEKGDIILGMPIESANFPGLTGDWEIVIAKPRFTTRHDGGIAGWFRYLLVKPAKEADAAKCLEAKREEMRRASDWAMNS